MAQGRLSLGERFVHESITGGLFTATPLEHVRGRRLPRCAEPDRMDVDGPAVEGGARFMGEDLHVAGQDDQVGPVLFDQFQ